jgi:penicillin-binding protein A
VNAPLRRLAGVVVLLFACLLTSATYVQFVDSDALNSRPGNARALYKQYGRERGPIVVGRLTVASSVPSNDSYRFQRRYSAGPVYSAVTGFYSIVYGATGVEDAAGSLLSGTADQLFYRRVSDLLTGQQPQGASVELTIDPKVQQAAWDALGDQRGAVVAIDPATGDILALVTKPAYDPNLLAGHSSVSVGKAYQGLLADPARPLENRAISGRLYPPGSVFKIVTAAAALSTGQYHPDTQVPGPAALALPQTKKTLPNDFPGACLGGTLSLQDALRISCNTAFGGLGMKIGEQAVADQARKFGFGQSLQVPLPVTASTFPTGISQASLAQASIGQFDVRVSPLQIAMVAAGIANKGVVMKPNLVRLVRAADLEVISKTSPQELSTALTPEVATELTTMMEAVVDSGTGTRAKIDGVRVAGKTGTAQQGEGRPPNAWFTSFAPVEAPKVAVAVVVDDGGTLGDAASGGRVAAPIAKKVMEAVLGR